MLAKGLLEKIGFSNEMKHQYYQYRELIGDKIVPYAESYLAGHISMAEALTGIRQFETEEISRYTIDLLFILEGTDGLLRKYRKDGIPEEIFIDSMKDIKYKADECMKVKGVFGTFVADWYDGFFHGGRVALGRLQFDPSRHSGEQIIVGDFTIDDGDFELWCHIPSAGPLAHSLCEKSYAAAYAFYQDRLKNGILPIFCGSWLLYPPYTQVFGQTSNTADFIRDFELCSSRPHAQFFDAWRIFNRDYTGNADELPQDTRMQRNFVQYIKSGGTFGEGTGILLYDGKKILTQKSGEI